LVKDRYGSTWFALSRAAPEPSEPRERADAVGDPATCGTTG
jgi:hypothetical protein